MTEKLPSVFDLTPLNPDFNDNPHALLDRLREECPVHRDEPAGTFISPDMPMCAASVGDRTHVAPSLPRRRGGRLPARAAAPGPGNKHISEDEAELQHPVPRRSRSRAHSHAAGQGALQARGEMQAAGPAGGGRGLDAIGEPSTFDAMARIRAESADRRDRAHSGRGPRPAGGIPRMVGRRDPGPQSVPHAEEETERMCRRRASLSAYMHAS